MTSYEGYCDHCGRDIGAGHKPTCPYYSGASTAAVPGSREGGNTG